MGMQDGAEINAWQLMAKRLTLTGSTLRAGLAEERDRSNLSHRG